MEKDVKKLLEAVAAGEVSVDSALLELKKQPFEDLGFAKVDHHRSLRQGTAEVIYGAGKTPEQIASIAASLVGGGAETVLITRMSPDAAELVGKNLPLNYDSASRIGVVGKMPEPDGVGTVLVALTAQVLGNDVRRLYDVGVAGLHRLLSHLDELMSARVIIAIAGMEGALASVVGGLVSCPVIAVPTSVGYGASVGGVSALLSMLNSCASGVSVVNIDNGFGAGYLASTINHLRG
jgi:hypothetical protein